MRSILPPADGKQKLIRDEHDTQDIISLLLANDGKYQNQVDQFCKKLKGKSVRDASKYIWQTLRDNVQYIPDSSEDQKLKSPARLFSDGTGDCKSFSLFAASCLRCLHIPYAYRFVSFKNNRTPTHVYVVAAPGSEETIIDGVLPKFDYEKPYNYKKDVKMALSMLTGVPSQYYDQHQLGLFKHLRQQISNVVHKAESGVANEAKKVADSVKKEAQKVETGAVKDVKKAADAVKKGVNAVIQVVKKLDPAMVLIRSGMLGIFYTNMFNSAGKLRLGFYDPATAQAKGYDMTEWNKLHDKVEKLKRDFVNVYGGNVVNLENAILHGKNKLDGAYIGQDPVSSSAAIAAAVPVVLEILKSLGIVDMDKMTKNAKKGLEENQALKKVSVTASQVAGLANGVHKLISGSDDSDNPHLQEALDQSGVPRGQRPKSAGNNNMLLYGGLAVLAVIALTNRN